MYGKVGRVREPNTAEATERRKENNGSQKEGDSRLGQREFIGIALKIGQSHTTEHRVIEIVPFRN